MGRFTVFKGESWPWLSRLNVDNFFAHYTTLMQHCACWPIEWSRILPTRLVVFSNTIDRLYFSLLLVSTLHLALLWPYTFIIKFKNLQSPITHEQLIDIGHCLIESALFSFSVYGLLFFRLRHNKCAELIQQINKQFLRRSAIGLTYVTIEPCHLLAKNLSFIWFFFLFGVFFYVSIHPILTLQWQLPIPLVMYPFDYNCNNAIFLITFAAQSIALWTVPYVYNNFESFLLSTVILLCGQLDILFCSLKNIRSTAMLLNNIGNRHAMMRMTPPIVEPSEYFYSYEQTENFSDVSFLTKALNDQHRQVPLSTNMRLGLGRAGDSYLMEYSHELSLALRSCIHHHLTIVKTHSMMEEFFNPFLLVNSMHITLEMCNLAFALSQPLSKEDTLKDLQYIALAIGALTMLGYIGNSILYESNRITAALARCPWHLCGGPFRRDVLMVMKSTAKPMALTGGKFFIMDFNKVKAILSASFSYYTLLQEIG